MLSKTLGFHRLTFYMIPLFNREISFRVNILVERDGWCKSMVNVRLSPENVIDIGKPMHCLYDDSDKSIARKITIR